MQRTGHEQQQRQHEQHDDGNRTERCAQPGRPGIGGGTATAAPPVGADGHQPSAQRATRSGRATRRTGSASSGTIVRPATSTFGMPGAAVSPRCSFPPRRRRRRSPWRRRGRRLSSRTRSVTGMVAEVDATGRSRSPCRCRVARDLEDVAGRGWRVRVEAAVGDPGPVRVGSGRVDAADEPVRVDGRVVVEARPGHRGGRLGVDVRRDEQTAGAWSPPRRSYRLPVVRSTAAMAPPARSPYGRVGERHQPELLPVAALLLEGAVPGVADPLRLGERAVAEPERLGPVHACRCRRTSCRSPPGR